MSPEALILQPKVTEVRAGIWKFLLRLFPSVGVVGFRGTSEMVGAVGVLYPQQVWG